MKFMKVEEYAESFRVCRTTVFEWLRNGKLKPGVHYIKIGRCLRFVWDPATIKELNDINTINAFAKREQPKLTVYTKKKKNTVINMNY